ncbi:gamma-glutamylcyclotransferase family protein [Chloroflexota bacterium]
MSSKSNDVVEGVLDERGSSSELTNYYAYGSLLSMGFLKEYCPSVAFVMKADLPNYVVQFRQYSERRQGDTSCIIEAPGHMVRGVLYTIAKEEIHDLDVLEGVPPENRYKRETFLVLGEDGEWYEADLYRLVKPTGPHTPAKSYLDDMIEGAQAHGLDPEYTERLIAWRRSLD